MPSRRPNPNLAKIHRNYSVEEVAKLYSVHRNTVRAWVKQGLPIIDERRPLLILGSSLVAYLQTRRTKNKQTCQPGEIYCLRCRVPRTPADLSVQYRALTPTQGNLVGACPCCHAGLYRRVSLAKLELIRGSLAITMPQALEHISESTQPSLNSDLRQDGSNHGNTQPQERTNQASVLRVPERGETAK